MTLFLGTSLLDAEEAGFVREALEVAVEEAEEVLSRHKSEEPPLVEVQTLGEAAEDYSNLVATQQRRVSALKKALELCGRG